MKYLDKSYLHILQLAFSNQNLILCHWNVYFCIVTCQDKSWTPKAVLMLKWDLEKAETLIKKVKEIVQNDC